MPKILVAEDSIIVNQHIRFTLESAGHKVITAYSGKEAVALAKETIPDLILMDIIMESHTDGIDAAMEIKQYRQIPIIFLTAMADEPTIQKAKFSLPYGYVIKPFNEAELLSNIDVAIYKAEAEKQIQENSELFQMIINSMNQSIVLLDDEYKIQYTNGVVERLMDCRFDQLRARDFYDVFSFHCSDRNYSLEELRDGGSLELLLNKLPYTFGDFKVQQVEHKSIGLLVVFSEITDKVKMREARENLKNKQVASLIEGQEKERERIARDLHDGVGQVANLIKLEAKKLEHNSELIKLVDLFLEEMRQTTDDLLPSRLNDFPLDICVKGAIEQANKRSDITFDFQSADIPDIGMSSKINIYRIVQECISNTLKHSGAKKATVQLFGFDDYIQLSFEDDGKGFDMGSTNDFTHHGLQNIQFRSEVMRATCDIESRQGKGTFVNIIIPLNEN